MENPQEICSVNVEKLQRKLACIPPKFWLKDELKRKSPYHPDTSFLTIRYPIRQTSKKSRWTKEYYSFVEELDPIFETIRNYYSSNFVKIVFTSIPPGGKIHPHVDDEPIAKICHRLHVPVITDPSVLFTLNGRTHHLREGTLYEIDIRTEHSVENNWNFCRIHLVMDIFRNLNLFCHK